MGENGGGVVDVGALELGEDGQEGGKVFFRTQRLRAFASASRAEEGSGDLTEFVDLFEKGGELREVFSLGGFFYIFFGEGGEEREKILLRSILGIEDESRLDLG